MDLRRAFCATAIGVLVCAGTAGAQAPATPVQPAAAPVQATVPPVAQPAKPAPTAAPSAQTPPPSVAAAIAGAVVPPDNYVIGVEDILMIVFWREKDMSTEVAVRPDGKVTLPLINDVLAAGLTPDQLREKVTKEAERFIEEPAATVVVKQINSRRVYITGEVGKPGPYSLNGPTTVLQLIALSGGLREYAKKSEIVIMRSEGGKSSTFQFDYSAVSKRKKLDQNILLKPGDTVVVP